MNKTNRGLEKWKWKIKETKYEEYWWFNIPVAFLQFNYACLGWFFKAENSPKILKENSSVEVSKSLKQIDEFDGSGLVLIIIVFGMPFFHINNSNYIIQCQPKRGTK